MKRLLSITCLCALSPWAIVACGSNSNSNTNASNDGGVSFKDIDDLDNKITSLKGDVGKLSKDLGTGIDGVAGDIKTLGNDVDAGLAAVDARLHALETVGSCSAGELCIPDGVDIVQMGVKDIVTKLCESEINCCNADELNYKFGPGIKTVKDCTATFVDLVNHGFSPSFLSNNGYVVQDVISIAQAMNTGNVKLSINTKGVKACVDYLAKQECPTYAAGTPSPARCSPYVTSDSDTPCLLAHLITGGQAEGEPCGIVEVSGVPECTAGLACRSVLNSKMTCAKVPTKGDRCTNDSECDVDLGINNLPVQTLFCNHSTGKCQARGGAGDECTYIDPTFTVRTRYELDPFNNQASATSVDCLPNFQCDPASFKCVPDCSEGGICNSSNGNQDCPEGTVCNLTEIPELSMYWPEAERYYGVCRPATADGDACSRGSECDSGRCDGNPKVCLAALVASGETCPTAATKGLNADCATGYCDGAGKCATSCTTNASCGTDRYCDDNNGFCEPKIADASVCGASWDQSDDTTCVSGFCNDLGTCEAKKPNGTTNPDDVCDSGRNLQCANGWCNISGGAPYLCTAFILTDASCLNSPQCGPGAYCSIDNKCRPYAADGAACNSTDALCDPKLTCADIGSADKCHYGGEFPNGAKCGSISPANKQGLAVIRDYICASGWCSGNDVCKAPIAKGDDCDIDDVALNRCDAGLYCNYPNVESTDANYHKGVCTEPGLVGQRCETRFGGLDCLDSASCELKNDQYVCGEAAVPAETLFCDGN